MSQFRSRPNLADGLRLIAFSCFGFVALLLTAFDVPLWARMSEQPHRYAISLTLTSQMLSVVLFGRGLFRSSIAALLIGGVAVAQLQLASLISDAPTKVLFFAIISLCTLGVLIHVGFSAFKSDRSKLIFVLFFQAILALASTFFYVRLNQA